MAAIGLAALGLSPANGSANPDPGGDPDTPISVPPPGKYFGLNGSTITPAHGLSSEHLAGLAGTAGANAVRGSLNWQSVEARRDQWSDGTWAAYDRFYASAREAGLTPIMILGNAPHWARSFAGQLCLSNVVCAYPPRPAMDQEWAQFAAESARRYPHAIFQIWNEPNIWGHWQSGPDPWRYQRLQVVAYDAIKAVNPDAMVLSAGFANVATSALLGLGPMSLREFLAKAYSGPNSIKDHMDALAFHPYPGPDGLLYTGPKPNLGAGSTFARGFDQVRTIRNQAGDGDTPLFVTETGVSTAVGLSRAAQANATRRIYRKTLSMDDVAGVVFHRIDEPLNLVANLTEVGSAWLRSSIGYPPAPFPVFCAFVADAGNSYAGC